MQPRKASSWRIMMGHKMLEPIRAIIDFGPNVRQENMARAFSSGNMISQFVVRFGGGTLDLLVTW
jgi:hypothetical protein